MWRNRRAAIAALALVAVGVLLYAFSVRRDDATARTEREALLRTQLAQMRAAIEAFRSENARYPHNLEALVPKYLPSIPVDPLTGSSRTWRLTTEQHVQPSDDFGTSTTGSTETYVIDVHSGAGKPYADY